MTKHKAFLRILFSLATVIATVSCGRQDVETEKPEISSERVKIQVIKGNNQTGFYGDVLGDTIVLKLTSPKGHKKFRYHYEVMQGNGKVTKVRESVIGIDEADMNGQIKLFWSLGCDVPAQKIRVTVYPDSIIRQTGYVIYSNVPGATITLDAKGVKSQDWTRSCGCERLDIMTTKIISPDGDHLYLINDGVYLSTDGGLNWERQSNVPGGESVKDAFFNSKGWMYVVTQGGGVYYSKDMQNWEQINNGFVNARMPTTFWGDDELLVAGFDDDGLYISKDNGGFWRKQTISGHSDDYYHFQRHPDGRLFVWDEWDDLHVSDNKGKTWSRVSFTENWFGSKQVYDFKISPDGQLYIGADDAILAIGSATDFTGTIQSYHQYNSSNQDVNCIRFIGDDVYYLVRRTPNPGLYSKSNGWAKIELGFSKRIIYYYPKKDGSFLLLSDDGLYVK